MALPSSSPLNSSMMSLGSCNVLARELITTIHHLCCDFVEQSSEQTHLASPEVGGVSGVGIEPEDGRMAALTSYLLQGRGSLLLCSLDALPDKEITCREDLLNLLLSLLPLLWKIPVKEASSRDFILPTLNESLFAAATNQPSPLSSHLPCGLARKAGLLPLSLGQSYPAPGKRARRQRKGAIGPGIARKNSTDSELSSGECPPPIMSTYWKRPTGPPPLAVAWTLTSEDFSPPKPSQCLPEEEGSVEVGNWNVSDSDTCQPLVERIHSPVCELDKVNANEPLNSSGSPFELCRVLLSLLNKMCSSCYLVHSGQRGQTLTVGIIPSLLRFLGALGEETGGAFVAGWTGESVALIQRMLLRCILRILVAMVSSSRADHDESNMEVLQTAASDLLQAAKTTQLELKRASRQPASPFSPKPKCTEEEVLQTKQVESDTETGVVATGHHTAFLGPELLHGTLQIALSAVCASGSNPFFLSQTMEFLREFVSGHGFKLYHEALLSLEKLLPFGQTFPQVCHTPVLRDARFYIRVLIADVTAVIVAVKKARINRTCPSPLYGANAHRKRHHHRLRQSTSPVNEHHHSDLSGQPAFTSGLHSNHSPNPFDLESLNNDRILLGVEEEEDDANDSVSSEHCCVALFAARCLSVASMATSLEVASRVLVAVRKAGVCCCLDPREVVRPVFRCICGPVGAAGGRAFQQYALAVLARLMLDQLGGHASGLDPETKLHVGQQCTFCSPEYVSSSSDLKDVEQVRRRWEILENYTGLVLGDAGPLTALLVVRHASYLARNGCGELRRQVFVHVMAPLLRQGAEAACQLVPITSEDRCICAQTSGLHQRISTPGLLCSCLDTLRVLLHDSSLLDLLLASNGLSQLVDLLSMEAVRPVLLVLFQALLLTLEKQPQPGAEQDGNHCSDVHDVSPTTPHHTQPAECDLATRRRHTRIGCQQPGRQKPYFERNWWLSDLHHAVVDCILKVAVGSITVKRSWDYKATVTPDSEDTSGYDSTAASQGCDLYNCSALTSPIDVALPSCETSMRFASDLWGTSSRLSRTSAAFCCHCLQSGAFHICRRALSLTMASFWFVPPRKASKPGVVDARTLLKSLHEPDVSTASSDLSSTECLVSDKPTSPTSPSELAVDLIAGELDLCSRCESTRNGQRPMTDETPEAFGDTRCCSVKRSPTPSDVIRGSVGVAGGFACETAKSESFTLATVNLLKNLLAICLQSSAVAFHQDTAIEQVSQGTQPVCSVPELLKDVQRQLTESHVLSTSIAWPLYEALLAVAFPEDLTSHDWWSANYGKDDEADLAMLQEWDKKWQEDVDEDEAPMEVIGKKSSLTESSRDGGEEGYEADSESNPEEIPTDGQLHTLPYNNRHFKAIFPARAGVSLAVPMTIFPILPYFVHLPLFNPLARISSSTTFSEVFLGLPVLYFLLHSLSSFLNTGTSPAELSSHLSPLCRRQPSGAVKQPPPPGSPLCPGGAAYLAYAPSVSKDDMYPRSDAASSPALGVTGAAAVSCGVNTGRQHVLLFPEVCGLVVQLLVAGAPSPDLNVVCKALRSLHNIAKSREENVASLNEQDIVKSLLTGFGKFLSQEDPELHELQVVLVDLLVTLAAVQISPEELALLLKLFTVKSPPTELLLDAILHVVQANMEPVPSQFLTFPLLLIQPSSSMCGAPLPTAWVQKVKGRTASRMLHVFQDISGLHANKKPEREMAVQGSNSVWSLASLQLPLPASQVCWPHQVTSQAAGFSVALWLRLEQVREFEGGSGSSMERRRKPMKNRLVVFRDSSIESTAPGGIASLFILFYLHVCSQDIVKSLLTGFGKFLSQEDPELHELQVVLVDLLVTLAAVQISPEELALLLKLFTVKSPPTELLLDAILHVVQANMEPVPSQFLTFPLLLIQPSSSMCGAPLPTAWAQKVKGRTASRMLHVFQDISGLHANKKPEREMAVQGSNSVWSLASLQLPLPASQVCWPHQVTSQAAGFSVALWLRLEQVREFEGGSGSSMERRRKPMKNRLVVFRDSSIESTEGERVVVIDYPLPVRSGDRLPTGCSVHLISIGSRCLMLQVWAEPGYGLLVFRVVVDHGDGRKADLLAQAESREGVLAPGQWHHMALSYRQRNEGKRNARGRLAVWIDGRRNSEVALDFAAQLSRKAGLPSDKLKTFCFVGHSVACQEDVDHFGCSWSLGNLLVFNDAVLDSLLAFHLYSCGPDLRSVLPCKLGVPPPLYTRYADLDILRTGQLQDLLVRGQGLNLSSLSTSVCLAYSPGVPATYTTYEYPSPGRGLKRPSLYRQPPIPRDVPLAAGTSVLVSLYPRVHQGLQVSLYNVGCIGAFIFLFARVVELCTSEQAQACALQSVLSLAKRHQRRWNELTADRGHAMLFQVLGKPRAYVGFHVLKVLLDAACDCSVLSWDLEHSRFELDPETHAVIQDVELLGSMLSAWRVWARAQAGVWETLMAAVEILIRETHPAQIFNVKQLLRARLVEQLLLTCLLLQENENEDPISLPPAVSRALVRLVEELIGSPPDSELLASVCSFLLAAHSPASTYVCHTSAAFYFSLHTDGRIVEEKLCAINALRMQSSPQASAPNTPDSSCSFAFDSPKVPFVSSSSNTSEMTKGKSPKGSPPSPVQPSSDTPKLRRQGAVRHRDMSLDDLRELPEVEAECGNLLVVGCDESRQNHQSSDVENGSASSQTLCDEVDVTIDYHSTAGVEEPCGPVDRKKLLSDDDETDDGPNITSTDESKVDDMFQGFTRKDHQTFDTGALDGAWGEHGLISAQSSFESADTISSRSESFHRSLGDCDTQSSSRLEAGTGCARMLQRVLSRNWDLGLAFPSVSHGTLNCPKSPLERSSDEEWTPGFFPGSSVDSDTTMATVPLWNSPTEDGLLLIFCGLYRLLHTMLLLLPDSMLPAFTDGLLTAEMLIVLCNHPSPDARLSVVKVLDAHFQRATEEQKTTFVRGHGFYLLANQLHQHVASRGLVETFLSLLRGQSLALDGEQEFESVKDIPSFQRRWVVPLLALVVPSLHDTLLAHDLLFTLLRLFGSCTRLANILLDSGLLSVLCNAATVLSAMDISTLPRSDGGLLLGDIQQFLLAATLHACTSAGSHYFHLLDDLLAMLGHFQTSQNARTQALAAALQFKVLNASINFIHSVVTARGRGITSSFSLPSKPHHALQQKRRSIAGTVPMWDSIIPRQPRQHLPSHASPAAPTSLQFGISSVPFARAAFAVPTSPGGRHLASGQDNVLIAHLRSAASEEFARLVQRRLSHDGVVCAREAELTQRLQRVSVMAVNRLLFHDTSYDAVDIGDLPAAPVFVWPQTREQPADDAVHETTSPRVLLQEGVFRLMAEGLKNAVEGARGLAPCQQWCRLLSSCRETFRVQFARLLLHVLSPLRPFSERLLGLSLLLEPSCKEILREVLTTPLQPGPKLAVSAFELLWEKSGQLSRQEQKSVELLLTLLKQAGTKIPGSCPAWPETLDTLHMEVENWNKEEAVNRESWWRRMVTTQQELLGRIEARGRVISRAAAQVTQRVASRQGLERKRVMEHLREACKADLGTQHSWQTLFCQLTHERAVWFDPVACPLSWQLDPTEGPSRERRRLQRCRVHVPNKYLLKDRRQSDDMSQPLLSYLFEDKSHFSGASAVKDRATSEPTKFTRHCISIVPSRETPGELLLGEKGMYFVEDNAGDSAEGLGCTGDAEPLSFSWAYEDIKEVHLRWFQLRDNALEIFLINGRTLLLNFESTKVRDQVYQSVLSTELPNLLEYRNLHALTQLWSSGQITNFEYLTHLNKHAGRSFNDLMQYPVMPFVLSDYTSEMLNLTDLQVYRNLAKPIAVQSKVKEDRYVHNYKWLEEEFQKGGREDDPMPPVQPYHYGSHYSNSGTTLHFLVRLPPFTKMFLVYQALY
uniref:lysosomal-trafficking regulator-like n=1 Tax=Myxine glutinosa TaxID=7769 RepID=UPI00358DFC63